MTRRPPIQTVANRLGALALIVTHDLIKSIRANTNHNPTDAAALVVIQTWPGISIGQLATVLGISPSGAVRLADRLEASGHLARTSGEDGRTVTLHHGNAAETTLHDLLNARQNVLDGALTALDDAELAALDRIASKLLTAQSTSIIRAAAICQLCDTATCVPRGCPVENPHQSTRRRPPGR